MPDQEGTPTWQELAEGAQQELDALRHIVRDYLVALKSPAQFKSGSVETCEELRHAMARLVGTVYPA